MYSVLEKTIKHGLIGEKAAAKFCEMNGYPFLLASKNLQKLGVDIICASDSLIKKVDVKNTFDIWICNAEKKHSPKILVRHPFKETTEANEIWILDKFTGNWAYQGSLIDYMLKFFINEDAYKKFLIYIQNRDLELIKSPYYDFLEIKYTLKKYVKNDVYVNFKENDLDQWSIRMISYKDKNYTKKKQGYY